MAAFDFDGTITRRDCLVPFLVRVVGRRRFAALALARLPTAVRYRGSERRDRVKEEMIAGVFADRRVADVEHLADAYVDHILGLVRPEAAERIRWHRSQGHELVIVSASLGVYLDRVAPLLGFHAVLAVSLEAEGGVYTGCMTGSNLRGPEKAHRLTEWLDGADAELWVYGDSDGDRELLGMASHPVFVGTSRRKRRRLGPGSADPACWPKVDGT